MSEIILSQIEKNIRQLPFDEQLLLISRVAEKLRQTAQNEFDFEYDLTRMADDDEIQAELRSIEHDFAVTELDGLAE
jgi:hypothetical protein